MDIFGHPRTSWVSTASAWSVILSEGPLEQQVRSCPKDLLSSKCGPHLGFVMGSDRHELPHALGSRKDRVVIQRIG